MRTKHPVVKRRLTDEGAPCKFSGRCASSDPAFWLYAAMPHVHDELGLFGIVSVLDAPEIREPSPG